MNSFESSRQKFVDGITVIGTGRLGRSLVTNLHNKGYDVHSLFNRSPESCETLAGETDTEIHGTFPETKDELGDLVFITVPDDQIPVVARQMADRFPDLKGSAWVHTSGATTADALQPLADSGGAVAAFHPVQTFNGQNREKAFHQCFITLQGDEVLCKKLKQIVRVLGARPLVVDSRQKTAIHLAAVLVCNYYATLFSGSRKVLRENNVEVRSRDLFGPLVQQTVEALLERPPQEVLTGPIVRGDVGSVEKHLKLLKDIPEWDHLYRKLGLATLNLARDVPDRDASSDSQLELKLRT